MSYAVLTMDPCAGLPTFSTPSSVSDVNGWRVEASVKGACMVWPALVRPTACCVVAQLFPPFSAAGTAAAEGFFSTQHIRRSSTVP